MSSKTSNSLQKGQSLVEFSLSLVVILIVVCGLLDLGRLYFTFVALEDGAGEAALYLSINPKCVHASDGPECANPNNAEYRAQTAAGDSLVDWSKVNLSFDRPFYNVGETVKVKINYSYKLLTPIIPKIVGVNPITVSAEASQTIITDKSF
jgi:hypothetical protein